MKKFSLRGCVLLVGLALGCGGRASRPGSGPVDGAPRLRLVGRFDEGQRFAWSGSAIEARFRGAALRMGIEVTTPPPKPSHDEEGHPFESRATSLPYAVFVDGRRSEIEISPAEPRVVVAAGLDPAAEHVVRVVRESEADAGVHRLLDVDLPEGGAFLPPKPRRHRLEVVGDSIACGYGVLGSSEKCGFSYATERATLAWPYLLGDAIDADVTLVCWSGKGVQRNYDGTTTRTMPELWARTFPADPRSRAAHDGAFDAVIGALGTNDFLSPSAGESDLADARFVNAYRSFLRNVTHGERVAAFVATSPMLPDEPSARFDGQPLRVLATGMLATVAMGHAGLLELPYQGTRRGCDYHPNAEMHRILAAEVEKQLRTKGFP